jgi:ATP-sulfurylase
VSAEIMLAPGKDESGRPFYGPYAAQELLETHQKEIGITMVPFQMMIYPEDKEVYVPEDQVPSGSRSSTSLVRNCARGYRKGGKSLLGSHFLKYGANSNGVIRRGNARDLRYFSLGYRVLGNLP